MASRPHINGSYLLDSCTVIDYQKVEALHILRSFATHCDSLRVSSLALAKEVRGLLRAEYEDLGVKILVPTLEQLGEAQTFRGISAIDACHLILCRDNSLILVTSDKRLWTKAKQLAIPVVRNLRLMSLLIEQRLMLPARARKIVLEMALADPVFLTPPVVDEFCRQITSISKSHRDRSVRSSDGYSERG
jgi:predicted nucleic acid-binding protein